MTETAIRTGSVIDERYRLEKLLGEGGHGSVWLAEDVHLKRRIAIKLVHNLGGDEEAVIVARMQREAKVLQRLDHPNIVQIHRIGSVNFETFFLAMEYVEGMDLQNYMASGPLSVGTAVGIAAQVADAMFEAEKRGVVHRDLKPQNILVLRVDQSNGVPRIKVADFGLSTTAASATLQFGTLTREGTALGTPLYMSPEQCQGLPTDARSDVYALGCVLYQMVTGMPPYRGETSADILLKHVREPAPKLSDVAVSSSATQCLQKVLDKCLAKNPADRYSSFSDARLDLDEIARETLDAKLQLRATTRTHCGETCRAWGRMVRLVLGCASVVLLMSASIYFLPEDLKGSAIVTGAKIVNPGKPQEPILSFVKQLAASSGKPAAQKLAEALTMTDEFQALPVASQFETLQSFIYFFGGGNPDGSNPGDGNSGGTTSDATFFARRMLDKLLECITTSSANDELTFKYLENLLRIPWERPAWSSFSHALAAYTGKLQRNVIPKTKSRMLVKELMAETILHTENRSPESTARLGDLYFVASGEASIFKMPRKARMYVDRASLYRRKYISDAWLTVIFAEMNANDWQTATKDLKALKGRLPHIPFAFPESDVMLAKAERAIAKRDSSIVKYGR